MPRHGRAADRPGNKGLKGQPGHTDRLRRAVLLAITLAVALLIAGVALRVAGSGPDTFIPSSSGTTNDMWFTTFSPPTVQRVPFRYVRGALTVGRPTLVAHLPGADGLVFAPSGELMVGGQETGHVYEVNPTSGAVQGIPTGTSGAFMVSLDRSGKVLYSSGLPGPLTAVPLDPPSPGRIVHLSGDDTSVSALAFGPHNQVLYTASGSGGVGNIGTVDLATGRTRRLFTDTAGAHGIAYDPYTDSYIVIGSSTVLQLPASDPGHVISQYSDPGMRFDQVAVTGRGQAFLASNTGYLVVIDYSASGRVGDVGNKISSAFLATNLDDVAPLIGPGARPRRTDAAALGRDGTYLLVAAVVILVIIGALDVRRRVAPRVTRRSNRKLPRWDRRRRRS